jgi:hypothetical protein
LPYGADVGYFFTKLLQGGLFRRLKAVIMLGHKHIDTLKEVPSAASQERVGKRRDLEKNEDGADGQRTDVRRKGVTFLAPVVTPNKQSYSEIVKRLVGTPRLETRSRVKRRKILAPLTLRQ